MSGAPPVKVLSLTPMRCWTPFCMNAMVLPTATSFSCPLTYTDEEPPQQAGPVASARRSQAAAAKAARQHDEDSRA